LAHLHYAPWFIQPQSNKLIKTILGFRIEYNVIFWVQSV
jgi:hypothetical protein